MMAVITLIGMISISVNPARRTAATA
jgi:hypothetical protein